MTFSFFIRFKRAFLILATSGQQVSWHVISSAELQPQLLAVSAISDSTPAEDQAPMRGDWRASTSAMSFLNFKKRERKKYFRSNIALL